MHPIDPIGSSSPLGASVRDGGVNFSLFSRAATGVELLLFDQQDDTKPVGVVRFDPIVNRTYHYWHTFVSGIKAGQIYGFRVQGLTDPVNGLRFDPAKVLLDPYGRAVVVPSGYTRGAASREGDNAATAMKILTRDARGHVLPNPPVLWDIETDPTLAGTKLIAEAWDAAGLYQVGRFVGDSWKEWNGRFRDDVRDFIRGEPGSVSRVADCLVGSHGIYGHKEREAEQSVAFVTCHDGFTLNDLVSYNQKHNEANGEENRDGANDNKSWNCGAEGPSDDPSVEILRNRQVKNFLTLNLMSLGVPMIVMGDEVRRTQAGNNNAYCHDSELNWFDWSLLERHADVLRFTRLLIGRRLLRDVGHEQQRISLSELIRDGNKAWHGVKLNQPDWSASSRCVAFTVEIRSQQMLVHLILNAYWESLEFELPPTKGHPWRRWIDTTLLSPNDIVDWRAAPLVQDKHYSSGPRSVVVLHSQIE